MSNVAKRELVRLVRNYKALQHSDIKQGSKKFYDSRCVLFEDIVEIQKFINEIVSTGADGLRIYFCAHDDDGSALANYHSVALVATHDGKKDWILDGAKEPLVKALASPMGLDHGSPCPPECRPTTQLVLDCADDPKCMQ